MISLSFYRETPLHIFYKYGMIEMANFVLRKKWYLLFYHLWHASAPPAENLLPPADGGMAPVVEGDGYTLVTSVDEITSGGQFVLVAENEGNY